MVASELDKIKECIFKERPLLKEVLDLFGDKNMLDYCVSNFKNLPNLSNRHEELIRSFSRLVETRLGVDVAREASDQLKNCYVVSTADHHGFLNSSLNLSSNYLFGKVLNELNSPVLKYSIVLSCANISLNNSDFPRGLLFHSFRDGNFIEEKFSILPSNQHSSVVYGFRSYLDGEINKVSTFLKQRFSQNEDDHFKLKKLDEILKNILLNSEVLNLNNFCEQVTKVNFLLWRELKIANNDLIYIEQEELVNCLILDNHLKDTTTAIHRFIFDDEFSPVLAGLRGVMEKFIRQGKISTYLFWYLDPIKKQRRSLVKKGNKLVNEELGWELTLNPEDVAEAIKNKLLIPDILLDYFVLYLYYGLNCLGGFNQIHFLKDIGDFYNNKKIDSEVVSTNPILYFYGFEYFYLHYLDKNIPASPLDLIVSPEYFLGDQDAYIKQKKLKDVFEENVNIIYNIIKV